MAVLEVLYFLWPPSRHTYGVGRTEDEGAETGVRSNKGILT